MCTFIQYSSISDSLSDLKLLQLSKKIGPSWYDLARLLGLTPEDIQEVKDAEGSTYQGAFKCMWMWRDRCEDDATEKQVATLQEALTKAGMPDVAQLL